MKISLSLSLSITRDDNAVPEKAGYVTPASWRRLRKLVKNRDGKICQLCGRYEPDGHVDHITPLSKGGTDSIHNLQWLCPGCNLSKGNRMQQEESPVIEIENVEPVPVVKLPGEVTLDIDRAIEFLEGVIIEGKPITQKNWSRKWLKSNVFHKGEMQKLYMGMEEEGYAYPRQAVNSSLRLTPLGKTYLHDLLEKAYNTMTELDKRNDFMSNRPGRVGSGAV